MFDQVLKGERDTTVEELVEKVTEVLKVVADDLWVSWAARLIPNVAHQVREEAEARVHKERKQNT